MLHLLTQHVCSSARSRCHLAEEPDHCALLPAGLQMMVSSVKAVAHEQPTILAELIEK